MKNRIFRVMLVDDESGATKELSKGLSLFREIEVIAQFNDPVQAVKEIINAPPDVLFLDVQMPGMTGFDVVEALDHADVHPAIIFVTAFDKYAIDAIHHAAFDYLLKPVEMQELERVVHRLQERLVQDDNKKMIHDLLQKINPKKRIKLSTTGGFILLPVSDILYIEADWNYADVYIDESTKHMVTTNIGSLEKMLPEADFCRISRSILINVNYLTKVNRLKRLACLQKDGKEYTFKIPLLNIRKLETRLE